MTKMTDYSDGGLVRTQFIDQELKKKCVKLTLQSGLCVLERSEGRTGEAVCLNDTFTITARMVCCFEDKGHHTTASEEGRDGDWREDDQDKGQ